MRTNRLRERLRAGEPSLGTRMHIAWPTVIELVGHAGAFDYVEILAEYAPYDLFGLENQARAIDLFDHMCGMVKIGQEAWSLLAGRAPAVGIQNLLFADVRTPEDAARCVRLVRAETPELGGVRGVGQGRDVGVVLEIGSPAYVQSTVDSVVSIMIEKREAVENLDAILAVPGIDMVQFGPVDYAMSVGLAGQRDHPLVRDAEWRLIETAQRMGVTPRAEIGHPGLAQPYLARGVRHFCMGTDVRVLYGWYREHGIDMRDRLTAAGAEPIGAGNGHVPGG